MRNTLVLGMLLASSAALAEKGAAAPYDVKGQYYETCSCTVSCPCAAQMKPTEPHCDAAMAFHIEKGKVGKVSLDGLNFVGLLRSPKDQVVADAFEKGEVDLFTLYFDDKATPEQREALGKLMPMLFGAKELKGTKPPQFVPMKLEVKGDAATLDAAGGKLAFAIENLDVGNKTKLASDRAGGKGAKRIQLSNSAPFPFIKDPTQGKTDKFHYDDLGAKWDHTGRNAFFSTFAAKGTIK